MIVGIGIMNKADITATVKTTDYLNQPSFSPASRLRSDSSLLPGKRLAQSMISAKKMPMYNVAFQFWVAR